MKVVGIDQIKIFVVLAGDHRIAAIDLSWKQRHAFVACGRSVKRRHPERLKVRGRQHSERMALPLVTV